METLTKIASWAIVYVLLLSGCKTTYPDQLIPRLEAADQFIVIHETNIPVFDDDRDGVPDFIGEEVVQWDGLGLPPFNIPPPAVNKILTVNEINTVFENAKTLGDIDEKMESWLSEAGFEDKYNYFKVVQEGKTKPGIAYVTEFEQINETGEPIQGKRWDNAVEKSTERNWLFIRKIGTGYFRFFVFVFMEGEFGTTGQENLPSKNQNIQDFMSGASTGFPKRLRPYKINENLSLYVLIYEYEQQSNQSDGNYKEMRKVTTKDHLRKAGLGQFLKD